MDEGQDKTKRGQLVAMLETLLQRQEEDRKDTVKPKKTFYSVLIVLTLESRLDRLEKQTDQDRETTRTQHGTTQKLLQKQCEAMQATFQQSLVAQNDHIL